MLSLVIPALLLVAWAGRVAAICSSDPWARNVSDVFGERASAKRNCLHLGTLATYADLVTGFAPTAASSVSASHDCAVQDGGSVRMGWTVTLPSSQEVRCRGRAQDATPLRHAN